MSYFAQIGVGHKKNEIGFKLMAKEANATIIEYDTQTNYELLWIPVGYYNYNFPNVKRILYGPHNFVFPTIPWVDSNIQFERSIYTCLSEYNKSIYNQFGTFCMPVQPIPFPVDVEKFCPKEKHIVYDCFIYFKGRHKQYLELIEKHLQEKQLSYKVIVYGSYEEEDYISLLSVVKFGIWIGSHESQGFALQEALSTNTPLLIYNVKSLNDEVNSYGNHSYMDRSHYDLSATSCPYWDKRCGVIFYEIEEFEEALETIRSTKYNPRDFILETLSPKVCYERLLTYYT